MRIEKRYITNTKWGRPGIKRNVTRYIDIHDPGGVITAENLWQYIESDKTRYKSYNTIIGHNGEIIELMPNEEVSYSNGHMKGVTDYASQRWPNLSKKGYQNIESFGVCLCRIDSAGNMTEATWDSAVWYLRLKLDMYELDVMDLVPHFNITNQKVDPLLFFNNPSELDRFRWEVKTCGKTNR